jgi:hypothetical protein
MLLTRLLLRLGGLTALVLRGHCDMCVCVLRTSEFRRGLLKGFVIWLKSCLEW